MGTTFLKNWIFMTSKRPKIFFEALLTLVFHSLTSGLDLQMVSQDLILGQNLASDSFISFLKATIASNFHLGLKIMGTTFLKNWIFLMSKRSNFSVKHY